MSDEKEVPVAESVSRALAVPEPDTDPEWAPSSTIESRFLFVDVAALRAKQLRRGARARVPSGIFDFGGSMLAMGRAACIA